MIFGVLEEPGELREKTFSEAVNLNDPGPKTFSAHVLQTQRLDTVFNDNSLVSSSKPVHKKREVEIGMGGTEIFEGVVGVYAFDLIPWVKWN